MIKLEPFYIHVNSPEESEIVQKLLFKCGYGWQEIPKQVLKHINATVLTLCDDGYIRWSDDCKYQFKRTITLVQLISEIESQL